MTATNPTLAPGSGPATGPLLEVQDLHVEFRTDEGVVKAVDGVSFTIGHGETLAIVGESGSGKSVTAMSIMGLVQAPAGRIVGGEISLAGKPLVGLSDKDYEHIRGREIAMIFQDPMTSLNPVYRVGDQIAEAITTHFPLKKGEARTRVIELLASVGIPQPEQRVNDYPHQFSGGMRQRAMIAMGMANHPQLLIADEPTTALDVTIQAQVLEVLRAAQDLTGAGLLLITHDLGIVAGMADRVVVMYGGKVAESGTLDDIFYRPRHPYTLGLLNSIPQIDDTREKKLRPIPGSPPSLLSPPSGCVFHPRCRFAIARCTTEVPQLRDMDGPGHQAACHRSEELPELVQAVFEPWAAEAEHENPALVARASALPSSRDLATGLPVEHGAEEPS